jgi:hypothetical protein
LESLDCWGPSRYKVKGSYGAAPDFKHVKRLLLNATDWASYGRRFILGLGRWNEKLGVKFFTEFFPAVKEILLAQSFSEPRRGIYDLYRSGVPKIVNLEGLELWENYCIMERDFRHIMPIKIPGWKAPRIKIVRSRFDMTEVMLSDQGPQGGSSLETEAIYNMFREYQAPPPRQYWIDFGVPVPESSP